MKLAGSEKLSAFCGCVGGGALDTAVLIPAISVLSLFLVPFFLHLCHWNSLCDCLSTSCGHREVSWLKKFENYVFLEVVPTKMR